jgi:hypothetical protein
LRGRGQRTISGLGGCRLARADTQVKANQEGTLFGGTIYVRRWTAPNAAGLTLVERPLTERSGFWTAQFAGFSAANMAISTWQLAIGT